MTKKKKSLKAAIKHHKSNENIHITELKRDYNLLKEIITGEIAAMDNSSWIKFLEKQVKRPTSSAPFWRKINYHKKKKKNSIKSLSYNNKLYHTDVEKANLFAELLHKTFSEEDNNKFDSKFKKQLKTNTPT